MADQNLMLELDDFWVQKEGNVARVGLSIKGLEKFKNSTFVDLPVLGEIKAGDPFLHVETSKVMHEITSPLSGTIQKVNAHFLENPSVNEDVNWIAVFDQEKTSELRV